jgi:enediyne biosynthesis protein E4
MIDNYSQQVKYKEPLLLFHQEKGQLRNVSAESGPVFGKVFPARGLAIGDFNNDGRIDVLVGNNGGPPVLLRNNAGQGNHWLGVKLAGAKCNRDGIGARLTWSAGGVTRSRLKNSGGSYLSSHDMREVLGGGAATKIDWLEIEWPKPSGRKERFTDLQVDQYITIAEGSGAPAASRK